MQTHGGKARARRHPPACTGPAPPMRYTVRGTVAPTSTSRRRMASQPSHSAATASSLGSAHAAAAAPPSLLLALNSSSASAVARVAWEREGGREGARSRRGVR